MVSEKLKNTILAALNLDDWDIQEDTTAGQVPGWDSLTHVKIVSAVEDAFGIRFQTREVVRLSNVGHLQSLVDKKLA